MKLALAIPHLPDNGPRTLSANALLYRLGFGPDLSDFCEAAANAGLEYVHIFKDKEPNHAWAYRVWSWFAESDADWGVQLQDDTLTPEAQHFWPILRAQLAAAPGDVVGLATVHPDAPRMMRDGHRWFRTRAWSIGWGVAYRTRWIREILLPWRSAVLEHAITSNEDSFVNDCVTAHAGSVYHPIPSLVDHDVSLASTYASVDDGHRRSTTRWTDLREEIVEDLAHTYGVRAILTDDEYAWHLSQPDFWRPTGVVPLLPFPEKRS